MTAPKLSIIIPTWNTAAITAKCVSTILSSLKPAPQIIIVDNGSTDNTSQTLKPYQDNIVYLKNDTNLGFSKANNIGAFHATGDYLLFLNSDMELIDSTLLQMLDYLDRNPVIGLIGPRFLNPDLTPQPSVFPPQTPLQAFREFWLGQPNAYSKSLPEVSSPVSVWAVSGGAVMIKKDLFNRVGRWNESYFMYFEDLDLCRAVRRLGLRIYYYPACRVVHRHGASGAHLADSQNQWRRLIPGSIKYHGRLIHYLITLIIWTSQKWKRIAELKP